MIDRQYRVIKERDARELDFGFEMARMNGRYSVLIGTLLMSSSVVFLVLALVAKTSWILAPPLILAVVGSAMFGFGSLVRDGAVSSASVWAGAKRYELPTDES
jgi:hypothetical protein